MQRSTPDDISSSDNSLRLPPTVSSAVVEVFQDFMSENKLIDWLVEALHKHIIALNQDNPALQAKSHVELAYLLKQKSPYLPSKEVDLHLKMAQIKAPEVRERKRLSLQIILKMQELLYVHLRYMLDASSIIENIKREPGADIATIDKILEKIKDKNELNFSTLEKMVAEDNELNQESAQVILNKLKMTQYQNGLKLSAEHILCISYLQQLIALEEHQEQEELEKEKIKEEPEKECQPENIDLSKKREEKQRLKKEKKIEERRNRLLNLKYILSSMGEIDMSKTSLEQDYIHLLQTGLNYLNEVKLEIEYPSLEELLELKKICKQHGYLVTTDNITSWLKENNYLPTSGHFLLILTFNELFKEARDPQLIKKLIKRSLFECLLGLITSFGSGNRLLFLEILHLTRSVLTHAIPFFKEFLEVKNFLDKEYVVWERTIITTETLYDERRDKNTFLKLMFLISIQNDAYFSGTEQSLNNHIKFALSNELYYLQKKRVIKTTSLKDQPLPAIGREDVNDCSIPFMELTIKKLQAFIDTLKTGQIDLTPLVIINMHVDMKVRELLEKVQHCINKEVSLLANVAECCVELAAMMELSIRIHSALPRVSSHYAEGSFQQLASLHQYVAGNKKLLKSIIKAINQKAAKHHKKYLFISPDKYLTQINLHLSNIDSSPLMTIVPSHLLASNIALQMLDIKKSMPATLKVFEENTPGEILIPKPKVLQTTLSPKIKGESKKKTSKDKHESNLKKIIRQDQIEKNRLAALERSKEAELRVKQKQEEKLKIENDKKEAERLLAELKKKEAEDKKIAEARRRAEKKQRAKEKKQGIIKKPQETALNIIPEPSPAPVSDVELFNFEKARLAKTDGEDKSESKSIEQKSKEEELSKAEIKKRQKEAYIERQRAKRQRAKERKRKAKEEKLAQDGNREIPPLKEAVSIATVNDDLTIANTSPQPGFDIEKSCLTESDEKEKEKEKEYEKEKEKEKEQEVCPMPSSNLTQQQPSCGRITLTTELRMLFTPFTKAKDDIHFLVGSRATSYIECALLMAEGYSISWEHLHAQQKHKDYDFISSASVGDLAPHFHEVQYDLIPQPQVTTISLSKCIPQIPSDNDPKTQLCHNPAIKESLLHDACTRDFTMSAGYIDAEGNFYAPLPETLTHIRQRLVHFIGDIHQRLDDDPSRILRFTDKVAQGNKPGHTLIELQPHYYQLMNLSNTKLYDLLHKHFMQGYAVKSLDVLSQFELFYRFFPQITSTAQFEWLCAKLRLIDAKYAQQGPDAISQIEVFSLFLAASCLTLPTNEDARVKFIISHAKKIMEESRFSSYLSKQILRDLQNGADSICASLYIDFNQFLKASREVKKDAVAQNPHGQFYIPLPPAQAVVPGQFVQRTTQNTQPHFGSQGSYSPTHFQRRRGQQNQAQIPQAKSPPPRLNGGN